MKYVRALGVALIVSAAWLGYYAARPAVLVVRPSGVGVSDKLTGFGTALLKLDDGFLVSSPLEGEAGVLRFYSVSDEGVTLRGSLDGAVVAQRLGVDLSGFGISLAVVGGNRDDGSCTIAAGVRSLADEHAYAGGYVLLSVPPGGDIGESGCELLSLDTGEGSGRRRFGIASAWSAEDDILYVACRTPGGLVGSGEVYGVALHSASPSSPQVTQLLDLTCAEGAGLVGSSLAFAPSRGLLFVGASYYGKKGDLSSGDVLSYDTHSGTTARLNVGGVKSDFGTSMALHELRSGELLMAFGIPNFDVERGRGGLVLCRVGVSGEVLGSRVYEAGWFRIEADLGEFEVLGSQLGRSVAILHVDREDHTCRVAVGSPQLGLSASGVVSAGGVLIGDFPIP